MKIIILMMLTSSSNEKRQDQLTARAWVKKTYDISGEWKFLQKDGEDYLVLEQDFFTSDGPDLKIYLTKLSMDEIDNRDSVDMEGAFIAELKSNKGKQVYRIPKQIDFRDYKSLVIHCKRYSVVWGGADY